MSAIYDESKLPRGEACSHYLADGDQDLPEGAAVAALFVATVCVLATLAAIWLVAMVYA